MMGVKDGMLPMLPFRRSSKGRSLNCKAKVLKDVLSRDSSRIIVVWA
jgi:hypothetical protein